jgi:hypothetical protein
MASRAAGGDAREAGAACQGRPGEGTSKNAKGGDVEWAFEYSRIWLYEPHTDLI